MCCPTLLLTLLASLLACRGASSLPTECAFPVRWRGTWFQSGFKQLIHISEKEVSSKGNCTQAEEHRYVVHNQLRRCYQCVMFYEKHENVIQYKESFCSPDSEPPADLMLLCGHVTGDRQLYHMFRTDYRPIECPLRGPFSFSYSRGHMTDLCSRPPSRLDRCDHDFRMLFRYQACQDVAGAEQAVEEMECLGMWKEGSARYLVTRRVSAAIASDEDRFRCFIYERALSQDATHDYQLAESGEATCSGLYSTSDGTRRLRLLRLRPPSGSKCHFPAWTTVHRRWHALDRRTAYQFNYKNTSLTVTGPHNETRLECAEIVEYSQEKTLLVVRATTGCASGFQCLAFYRRDGHVMESQLGSVSQRAEDACGQRNFDRSKAQFHTLVSSSQHHVACPHLGQYSVTGVSRDLRSGRGVRAMDSPEESFSSLNVGCQSNDTLVLSGVLSTEYWCQGSWRENDTFYLVASRSSRPPEGTHHFCFVYTVSPDGLRFSTVQRTCPRQVRPGVEGLLAFNVTARAECLTSSGLRPRPHLSTLMTSLLVVLASVGIVHR